MVYRIVDFEILTGSYKKYINGVEEIEKVKKGYLDRAEPLKKELNDILKAASSGIILDEQSEKKKAIRFQELQQEFLKLENDLKYEVKKMTEELNTDCYNDLSEIIKYWAIENKVDVVVGKMEVVWCDDKYDSTDDIIKILKEKELLV